MPLDAFDMLGLPPRFDLEAGAVERAYLARLTAAHPDHAGDEPVEASGDEPGPDAAGLNAARAVLLDAEQRARALLSRRAREAGVDGRRLEEDRSLPEGFLPTIMAAREALDAARAGAAAGGANELARLRAWAMAERDGHVRRVGALFASMTPPGAGTAVTGAGAEAAAALRGVARELNAWRYIERMLAQLDETDAAGAGPRSGAR